MTDYTKIKTRYVKKRLKELKFNDKNKQYIDILMRIEKYATNKLKCIGTAGGHIKFIVRENHKSEWLNIFKELNLKMYKFYIDLYRKEKIEKTDVTREVRAQQIQARKESEESKESWNEVSIELN